MPSCTCYVGVLYGSSAIGMHAGAYESYNDFKDLFYPAIEMRHKGFKIDKDRYVHERGPSLFFKYFFLPFGTGLFYTLRVLATVRFF